MLCMFDLALGMLAGEVRQSGYCVAQEMTQLTV